MKENYIERREKEDNFFVRLQKETLEILQALSGNIWTDFNLHDPGMTIAEILNYALYELQYQLQFPFETYLSHDGKIDFEKLGLFSQKEIMQPSIVTTRDYERVILSTVQGVENCKVSLNRDHKYEIAVEFSRNADKERVAREIELLYHAHRNLCETLGEVVEGKPEKNRRRSPRASSREAYADETLLSVKKNFLSEYYSIQNHFPDAYGVNEKGAPAGISDEHKAKIMQLKAYLLIFDHLLANTLHQSANAHKLLELSDEEFPLYQPDFSIAKIEELTDAEKFKNNRLQNRDFLDRQKSHFLDFLDVIYGEDTKSFFGNEKELREQNRKRAELIKKLPQWNANRVRSFNILSETPENGLPLQQLISVVLEADADEKSACLIEYILLDTDKDEAENPDRVANKDEEYNKLAIVIPWKEENQKGTLKNQKEIESLIRERIPVYIEADIIWMASEQFDDFQEHYSSWRKALANNTKQTKMLAEKIRGLIK